MIRRSLQREARRRLLSEVLKTLRARRGLRSHEVAARMGLETRSYERFEAGEVRLDLERLFLFAEATDSDPLAIVCALHLQRADLALLCADNNLMLIEALALERLAKRRGDRMRRLEAATLIDAFEGAFDRLAEDVEAREARARAWLNEPPDET